MRRPAHRAAAPVDHPCATRFKISSHRHLSGQTAPFRTAVTAACEHRHLATAARARQVPLPPSGCPACCLGPANVCSQRLPHALTDGMMLTCCYTGSAQRQVLNRQAQPLELRPQASGISRHHNRLLPGVKPPLCCRLHVRRCYTLDAGLVPAGCGCRKGWLAVADLRCLKRNVSTIVSCSHAGKALVERGGWLALRGAHNRACTPLSGRPCCTDLNR